MDGPSQRGTLLPGNFQVLPGIPGKNQDFFENCSRVQYLGKRKLMFSGIFDFIEKYLEIIFIDFPGIVPGKKKVDVLGYWKKIPGSTWTIPGRRVPRWSQLETITSQWPSTFMSLSHRLLPNNPSYSTKNDDTLSQPKKSDNFFTAWNNTWLWPRPFLWS